ncbi:MAG TPA: GNAT family N-acetyltransferase [Acetobacteraceae bacterium]|jgi:hypothetical protein
MNAGPLLVPSLDLVHRVTAIAADYTLARMRILQQIYGNPIGVAWRRVDDVVALMARHLPSPAFNSVIGLRAGQEHRVGPLVQWYRENAVAGRFELASGDADPALGRELARHGFFQSGVHAALIGAPDLEIAAPVDCDVRLVSDAAEMDTFLAAYVAGWGIPASMHDRFKANVRPWLGQPGWSLYIARIDGQPAAAATLFVESGIGYLADAATDPALRHRGLHAALLRRRVQDAHAAHVEFVCSGADFLSTSYRNMHRAGLRLLFLRLIWQQLDQPG